MVCFHYQHNTPLAYITTGTEDGTLLMVRPLSGCSCGGLEVGINMEIFKYSTLLLTILLDFGEEL